MHSLFSSRKSTTNLPAARAPQIDEFGALSDAPTSPRPQRHKDKGRKRTISSPGDGISSEDVHGAQDGPLGGLSHLPDGSFFPTIIPPKKSSQLPEYGYISAESDIILSLDDALRLVVVVDHELSTRGLKEPFLFSTKALDVSSARVRSLVKSFVATCEPFNISDFAGSRRPDRRDLHLANGKFLQEARFAGPHELGMLLKWCLARIARVKSGYEVRGFVELDDYMTWRVSEEAANYPPNHFPTILNIIPEPTHALFNNLFTLFSRFCAYSASSGLTPPALASHFGPLIFGLGPSSLPFGPTYKLYLRACHATEHLLLAYIQNSDSELPLGVELPTRLKGWIHGYPTMLPRKQEDLERPRPNQRMVPIASIRRNVRLYSSDLVQNATTWCGQGDHTSRKEWKRAVPSHSGQYSKLRYTEDYKKQLNLPKSMEPKTQYDGGMHLGSSPSTTDFSSSPPRTYRNPIDDAIARSHPELSSTGSLSSTTTSEDRFRNLADLQWSQFSETGFKGPDAKLLQFDLGETARRNARHVGKRDTINWADFTIAGFDRPLLKPSFSTPPSVTGERELPLLPLDPLAEVLQFSVPIERPDSWSEHTSELTRKLKKQQKSLPSFGWETGAVAGRDWFVEEGMIATWAEMCLSSGWMDRLEGTFRESNWALIEFKAVPEELSAARPTSRDGAAADPRTGSQWFLVEEFIPREYRDDLQSPKKKKNPLLASLNAKNKKWQPASTMNGQPYAGRPRSPNPRDYEFDAVIRNSGSTTKLTLSSPTVPPLSRPELTRVATPRDGSSPVVMSPGPKSRSRTMEVPPERPEPSKSISAPLFVPPRVDSKEYKLPSPAAPETPSKPGGTPKVTGSLARLRPGKPRQPPAEWDASIEFETRTESDTSGDDGQSPSGPSKRGHARRLSKQDAWVDIVVMNPDEQPGEDGLRLTASRDADPLLAQAEIDRVVENMRRAPQEAFNPRRSVVDDDEVLRPRGRHVSRADSDEVGIQAGTINGRRPTIATKPHEDLQIPPVAEPAVQETPARRLPLPASPYPPGRTPSPSGVRQLPPVSSPPEPAPAPNPVPSPAGRGSGVSSLVEMYHNKEAAALATIPPALLPKSQQAPLNTPSRLPVSVSPPVNSGSVPRSNSAPVPMPSPVGPTAATEEAYPAAPVQRPSGIPISVQPQHHTPSPPRNATDDMSSITEASEDSMEPLEPPPPLDPQRVPSPGRYVHGAPLTNVMEADEEEEY